MDTVHKQEYRIRDLPTRSVTLFPTRAQVLRDIKDVPLKVSYDFFLSCLGGRLWIVQLTVH